MSGPLGKLLPGCRHKKVVRGRYITPYTAAIPKNERGEMTNIQVEDLTEIKKKVTFEVPQEKVLELMDAEYRDLKKTFK